MAVVNAYVDPLRNPSSPSFAPRLQKPVQSVGQRVLRYCQFFAPATTDSNNSIYRLFTIPCDIIISKILIANDAITGMTVNTMGLYNPLDATGAGGAVINASLFASGLDLSAAHNSVLEGTALNAYTLNPQAISVGALPNILTRLLELAGLSNTSTGLGHIPAFDVCLTSTTRGAATGNIVVYMEGWQS